MEPPTTRYVERDGVNIGFQVVGNGPIDLVFVPGLLSQIDALWGMGAPAHFLSRLATFSRLIVYDKRGQGVSDPLSGPPSLEQDMEDLLAVLDAVGSESATLLGYSEGGPMSALCAATHPARVRSLLLFGSFASGPAVKDYAAANGWLGPLEAMLDEWGSGRCLEVFAPSIASGESARRFGAFERAVGSPAMVRAGLNMVTQIDVTGILATLRLPTLVMQRSGDRVAPRHLAKAMADEIPDARYIEWPGIDHIPWIDDADAVLDEIEEFVTGTRGRGEADRVLATVMFTDVVDSTRRAAELGDSRWRSLLDEHDKIVRKQIETYRGREVKTMGDGFLITFDGPARAIRCARSIADDVREIGLDVRAGLHTGECELVGDDVGGIAVHIGARVGSLAGPGEVLVSRTVRDLVVGSDIAFEERGDYELKGVPGEWQLFAVTS